MLEFQQIGVVLPLVLAAGCAIHRPDYGTYRLSARDSTTILVPPGVASPALEQRTLDVGAVRGTGPCPRTQIPILIRNPGKRFRLTIRRRALLDQRPGWLADWAAGLEEQGCLRPGAAFAVAEFIAESMPLDPSQSFRLLSSPIGGDILPLSRIQVVTPVLPPGSSDAPTSANLLGVETAWYVLQPRRNESGFTIQPSFAERTTNGQSIRLAQSSSSLFHFAPEASFFRLVYKQDKTGLAAWLAAGRTRSDLNQRTHSMQSGMTRCEDFSPGWCTVVPRLAAVNVFLPITVNGAEVLIRWGATLGEALRARSRASESILPKLVVERPYRGRLVPVQFDRSSPTVFRLPLMGGEVISWN